MCERERRGRKREKDTEIKNKTGDDGGIRRERVLEKEKKGKRDHEIEGDRESAR